MTHTTRPRNKWISLLITTALFASLLTLSTSSGAAARNIVEPKQIYTYDVMLRDIRTLAQSYPDLIAYQSIGQSEYGRELMMMQVGHGPVKVLLNGSHHAREWMTTITLMKMAEQIVQCDRSAATWHGVRTSDLLDHVTFYIVPMVNPDGVTLQQKGAAAFPASVRSGLIRMNGGSSNFKHWKANAKGIDLNRQYPAGWATIVQPAPGPSYMNYKGRAPLQAKEAKAMVSFTRNLKPDIAVSYHSSGEILFWNYKTKASNVERDRKIANAYAAMTGYRLVAPSPRPSGGGFTDWFITEFGKPGLTPELGRPAGETHIPLDAWDRIWKQQKNVAWMLGDTALSLRMQNEPAKEAQAAIQLADSAASYRSADLASERLGNLPKGIYQATRTRGSWIELQNGGNELIWVANSLVLPAPQPSETPEPAEPPEPTAASQPTDLP